MRKCSGNATSNNICSQIHHSLVLFNFFNVLIRKFCTHAPASGVCCNFLRNKPFTFQICAKLLRSPFPSRIGLYFSLSTCCRNSEGIPGNAELFLFIINAARTLFTGFSCFELFIAWSVCTHVSSYLALLSTCTKLPFICKQLVLNVFCKEASTYVFFLAFVNIDHIVPRM